MLTWSDHISSMQRTNWKWHFYFQDNCLPTSSEQRHSCANKRESMATLALQMQLRLKICIDKLSQTQPPINFPVNACLKFWSQNCGELHHCWICGRWQRETVSDGWTWTAESRKWLGPLCCGHKQWRRASLRRGKGSIYIFLHFIFGHTGFLLDERWHAFTPSHPAYHRYHSAKPLPPPASPLHLATASSQFYPLPTATTPIHTYIHPYMVCFCVHLPFHHQPGILMKVIGLSPAGRNSTTFSKFPVNFT